MRTKAFFQQLAGCWMINRYISNHAHVRGEATFKQIKTEAYALYYCEQGQLTLEKSKQTLKCYRDYVYRYQSEADAIAIYFVEEEKTDRLFHTLRFSMGDKTQIAQAVHHCRNDIYHVFCELIDKDNFKLIYKVSGPSKNYESLTFFQRKVCR